MRSLLPLVLVGALSGCEGLDAYPFIPHEGLWKVEAIEITEDECAVRSTEVLPVDLQEIWLEVNDPTRTFHYWVDESEPAPCEQLGDSFVCQPALDQRSAHGEVILSVATVTDGWFDSPMDMSGDFDMRLNCKGDGCDAFVSDNDLPGFPCDVRGNFDATAVRGVTLDDR